MPTNKHPVNTLHLVDSIAADVAAARAIMDAAKILAALERARAKAVDGSLATGEGFAGGYTLIDDTLPTLLAHGVNLMDRIEEQSNAIADTALAKVREQVAPASAARAQPH